MNLPPSNLQGNYEGSCVICLKGTDTGLAFTGEAEWALAGMQVLGIPDNQAEIMLQRRTGSDPGMVPDGDITVALQVCQSCVDRSDTGMTVGLVALGVPTYGFAGEA